MPRTVAAFVVALALASLASAQCPPQGVTVSASGGRLGDAWQFDALGPPNMVGVFGLDLAGGPTPTPLGPICLGFTPDLQTLAFIFDTAGRGQVGGLMPPTPAFAGIGVYATAIAFAPALPGGIGVSNGASLVLRQPHFWCVSPGYLSPAGTIPGWITPVNAISGNPLYARGLTSSVVDAVTVRDRGLLVLRLGNGGLEAYGASSLTPVWSVSLSGAAAQSTKMIVAGGDLLLLSPGSAPGPFGGGTPGSLHLVSLTNGNVLSSYPMASGNPDMMLAVPGTMQVCLRLANGVETFDWNTGQYTPVIPLPASNGGLVDWQMASGLLYVLHAGTSSNPAAISVISVGAQSLLWTVPLTMAPTANMLRAGPGSAGPALYVYGTAGVLEEYSQVLVAPVATIAAGSGIGAMELSALGTQWLLLCTGSGCGGPALLQLPVGTTALSSLGSLPNTPWSLAVSPSLGFGKACLTQGTNLASPFGTDPFTALGIAGLLSPQTPWRVIAD